jgi:hypothetical protein
MDFFKKIFSITNTYYRYIKVKYVRVFNHVVFFTQVKNKKLLDLKLIPLDDEKVQEKEPVYLSIVAIMKNEAPYIQEWIEFHKLVGVERFYLYDNESTDNTKEILKPYIDEGVVVYKYVEGKCKQVACYNDAIYKYQNQSRWIAFIDLDEFIVPVKGKNIPQLLKRYEKYPAVGVNWVMFDSNGHDKKPDGLVIENYTNREKRLKDISNKHIKSIVNPKEVLRYEIHFGYYKNSNYAVDTNCKKIKLFKKLPLYLYHVAFAFTKKNLHNVMRINHYHTKSREEYKIRCAQGSACSKKIKEVCENAINFKCVTVQDKVILKFLPELKQALFKRNEGV